jgi:hypothetical protein
MLDTRSPLKSKFPVYPTVLLCDRSACMGMPTGDVFHRYGECYHCTSYFCFEHLAESKDNLLAMSCMVEYYDNHICGTLQEDDEERCGRVGLF